MKTSTQAQPLLAQFSTKKNSVLTLFTALAASLTISGYALANDTNEQTSAQNSEKLTLVLDFMPDGLHAPIYVAQNKNYTGPVKLTIEPGNGSSLTAKLVSAGNAQIGVSDAGSASVAISKGANIKAIALVLKHTPAATVVAADSTITKIADLQGKSIGDFPEASTSVLLPAVLKANGLTEKDIQFVGMNFAARVPALQTGKVDAIDGYIQEFVSLTDEYRRIPWADNNFAIYGPVLIVNTDYAKKNPANVRAVIEGFKKGIKFTLENPRETAEILAKASRGDADFFEKEIKILEPFFPDSNSVEMSDDAWKTVQDLMVEYGGQTTKMAVDELFTNEFSGSK